MIRALILGVVLFLIFTFPATYLLMLFLGNIDKHLSYWGTLSPRDPGLGADRSGRFGEGVAAGGSRAEGDGGPS